MLQLFFKHSSRLLENQFYSHTVCRLLKGGGRVLHIMVIRGQYSGTFFRHQVYERVGNSRVVVYEARKGRKMYYLSILKGLLNGKMFRKDARYGYIFSERSASTVLVEEERWIEFANFMRGGVVKTITSLQVFAFLLLLSLLLQSSVTTARKMLR